MGKKDKSGAKRRRRLEEQKEREAGIESMNNEAELQAELRALNGVNNNNNNDGHDDSRPTIYNNKGLLSKCDAIDLNLDFPQTLAVVSRIPVANAVPNYEDEERDAAAKAEMLEAERKRKGRRSTILTGSGLNQIEDANVDKKTLLG